MNCKHREVSPVRAAEPYEIQDEIEDRAVEVSAKSLDHPTKGTWSFVPATLVQTNTSDDASKADEKVSYISYNDCVRLVYPETENGDLCFPSTSKGVKAVVRSFLDNSERTITEKYSATGIFLIRSIIGEHTRTSSHVNIMNQLEMGQEVRPTKFFRLLHVISG
jgi:hypothetical protein